jgi:hypothetical protein
MNIIAIALFSIFIAVNAYCLHVLQESLEAWDQKRHAED